MTTDAELARDAGISVPVLKAIRAVESGSNPSSIRFEPHVFLRERPDLVGSIPYTPSGTRGAVSLVPAETNRAAFERAYALDAREAVKATSWGTYQVLGGKLLAIYGSPADAVAAFWRNPVEASNRLLVQWMNDNPTARDAAARQDWFGFVCRYNGCGSGCSDRSGCERYLSRFETAYAAALGGGSVVGLLLVGGAAYVGYRYWRGRKFASRGRRRAA